tara:strand:- start:12565 stop:13737 length:1173 start_codon:yes stop_codon:yes gene_type:complete
MFIVMHQSSQGIYKKNILLKSLNFEVLLSTIGVLLIFFFLVVSSRFVGYFEQASEGLIDPSLVFKVVFLRFPDFITLLLPLSFFLGVIITVSRLYSDREIFGYLAGGLSENDLVKYLFPQAMLFFLITLSLSIFLAPYTKELSKEILSLDTIQEQFESVRPKELFSFNENDGFIHVENKENNILDEVIIFIQNDEYSSLIIAENLIHEDLSSKTNLDFKDGVLYQDIFNQNSSFVSYFGELSVPINNSKNTISGLSLSKLFDFSIKSSKSQTQWNLSIPLTIFVLLIYAVNFSKVEPRQGRFSVLVPSIFIYILYLSLLILARDSFDEGSIASQNYIWYVHLIFLLFAIFLLFRKNFNISIRNFFIYFNNNFIRVFVSLVIFLIFLWVLG